MIFCWAVERGFRREEQARRRQLFPPTLSVRTDGPTGTDKKIKWFLDFLLLFSIKSVEPLIFSSLGGAASLYSRLRRTGNERLAQQNHMSSQVREPESVFSAPFIFRFPARLS